MHELAITCSIVELVAENAQGRKVHRITLEVGELAGVETDSIAFWFAEAAKGTELEGASLDIRRVPALARCEACGAEFPTPSMLTSCACGSVRLQRIRGEELNVKSFELEEVS